MKEKDLLKIIIFLFLFILLMPFIKYLFFHLLGFRGYPHCCCHRWF